MAVTWGLRTFLRAMMVPGVAVLAATREQCEEKPG